MKKLKKTFGAALISATFSFGTAALASDLVEQGTLAVGSDLTYAPFAYMNEGKPAGFDVELSEMIAAKMGVQTKWVDTRFAALIPGIRAQHFDMIASALYVTEERLKVLSFIPYTKAGSSILVMAAAAEKPAEVADLCGKSVGSIRGASWVLKLQQAEAEQCNGKKIDIREFDTDAQALQALRAGAVEAQVADNLIAAEAVKRHAGEVEVSSKEVFFPVVVALAVQPEKKELLTQIVTALREIRADGSFEALRAKYDMAPVTDEEIAEISGVK